MATLEQVAALTAPPDLDLPDLGSLLPGTTAKVLPEHRFDAIYYDTRDLRLARSGITLRCRTGEPATAWTVTLPIASRGPVLSRRTIGFAGPPGQVPGPVADLVLASTRTRRLSQIARLAIARRPVEMRDGEGQLVAEVIDATVTVRGKRPTRQFREVKVKVHIKGRPGRRLCRAAVARLAGAGCVTGPPVPTLVRAIGDRATRPPDVAVASLGTHTSIADLVRHAIARSAAQILRHDPGARLGDDPEDVHQLRVGTRRLRSDLRTFAHMLDRDQVRGIRGELGWLGGQVGAVRDSDVLAAHLRAVSRTLPEADIPGAGQLLHRLDTEAAAARSAMLAAMRSPRYVRLLNAIAGLAATPPFTAEPGLAARAPAQVAAQISRRPWQQLAKAVSALGPAASDAQLHRVRIRAKRCRYAAEAVAPVIGPPAARFAAAVAGLQTVLGDHQDTVVAEAWLRDAAAARPAARVAAGQLIALERARRAELRAQWPAVWEAAAAKKLRRWLRSPR